MSCPAAIADVKQRTTKQDYESGNQVDDQAYNKHQTMDMDSSKLADHGWI